MEEGHVKNKDTKECIISKTEIVRIEEGHVKNKDTKECTSIIHK